MPPKVIGRGERATGVLPVSGAARAASAKTTSTKLKLEIRRLPPSLTLSEFEEVLGPEWKLGAGKIDWREYRQGKVKSPGKLPEQSRCYIHLVNDALVKEFEQRFLAVVFHDKAGTHKLADLKFLPPALEYAANQRVPITTGKQRIDNRQGTIDQDPEFIAFLEAETQPIVKAPAIDSLSLEREEAKQEVKSTPLIDDLREKKANRAKAAASKAEKKGHKHADSKDAAAVNKDAGKVKDKAEVKKTETAKDTKGGKQIAAKQAAQAAAQTSSPASARKKKERPQPSPKPATATLVDAPAPTSPAPQRAVPAQRARRDAEGIKKMLQKDLGIKPKDGTTPTGPSRSRVGAQANPAQAPAQVPTGLKATTKTTTTALPDAASTMTAPTAPASFVPKAFLKHANPSQGMTELLIQDALNVYGEVVNVTIDPRKGTAIAVFKTSDGLQKAIAAKKVSIANGAVEILEFMDRSAGGSSSRGTRGATRASRGRGNAVAPTAVSSNAAAPSAPPAG